MSQITQWLQSQGLSIVNVAQGRNWVAVSGSAAQIETAFTTEIHQYVVDGETHFANATNPSIPAAIGGMVLSIRGLNDFRMKPRSKAKFTSGSGSHYVAAGDIATIYDILPAYAAGIDGSGQKLVIAGQSEVPVADLQNYQSAFNLTGPLPQMVLVGSNPGVVSGDREESDIDLELSGAVARNASIILVYSNDVMDSVNYAIDQNLAPVISVSYGSCEQEAGAQPGVASGQAQALTFQSWAQRANAQGITWFDASGDDGAADCDDAQNPGLAVDTPASVPEVTAVGGTEFVEGSGTYWSATNGANGGSALSYIPETAWNDSVSFGGPDASGGGVSIFFPQPSWQAGFPGMPGNNARNVPDVALNASNAHDGSKMPIS
jgi:subtilase family serine protease